MGARRRSAVLALVVGVCLGLPAVASSAQPRRTWHVSVTGPAQFDLTLAGLRFNGPGASGLIASLTKAPGLYFVAGALVRHPGSRGPRALVLVVNERPRGSLAPDRSTIGLRVTGPPTLGGPLVSQVTNPFAQPAGSTSTGRVCGLGRALVAADLRGLLTAGRALPGFSSTAAVADAYDVVCGLPFDPAFKQAVTGCTTSLVAGCCPPNAMCVAPPPTPAPIPTPVPVPVPVPPPCGCPPPPSCGVGYACPLSMTRELTRVIACPLLVSPAIACA